MTLTRSLLAAALMLVAGGACAQSSYYDDGRYEPRPGQGDYAAPTAAHTDMARVLSVAPIVHPGQQQHRQECWRDSSPQQSGYYDQGYQRYPQYAQADPYRREHRNNGGGNGTGAVLGGLVGAALGHNIGDGNGRRAATVVGAVIGASIGHSIENGGGQDSRYDRRYQDRQRRGFGGNDGRYYDRQQRGYGGYDSRAEAESCRTVVDYPQDERVAGYRVTYEYAGRQYETITDYHPGNQLRVRVDVTPEQ